MKTELDDYLIKNMLQSQRLGESQWQRASITSMQISSRMLQLVVIIVYY
jgi:hypothetical protein